MNYFHGTRSLAAGVAALMTLLMVSSCSQTTVVQSNVSEAAVANLSPAQKVWHYVGTGDASNLDAALKANPDLVNIYEETTYNSPLHVAALNGDWDVVKVLVDNGADVLAENENSEVPSESALQGGDLELSKYLRGIESSSN